jgi:hypothetical protein
MPSAVAGSATAHSMAIYRLLIAWSQVRVLVEKLFTPQLSSLLMGFLLTNLIFSGYPFVFIS